MRQLRRFELRGLGPTAVACLLALGLGCGAVESPEELQSLAGESPPSRPQEAASRAAAAAAPAGDESLNGFPLVGSVFPGLGGRLHSSLCDPASDPYGTCL